MGISSSSTSTKGRTKFIFLQQARRSLGLALHRGWAKLMLDRCRDFVQHPNQPRSTAAEAADEDNEEAHAFNHHTYLQPPYICPWLWGVGP